jgi:hypothetical protein
MNSFDTILKFEQTLGAFTGAPFVIMTDCCIHAIELCLRYKKVTRTLFPARTYISIPMTMRKLEIGYHYRPTIEDAARGLELLPTVDQESKPKEYPDLRKIIFK